jgi:hypothetical protein
LYYGLIAGPIAGLFVGLQTLGTILSFPLTVLLTAIIIGLPFGWLSEPGAVKQSRKTLTRLWMRTRQRIATFLEDRVMVGLAAGLFIAITSALYLFLFNFDYWPLGSRIVGALSGGLPSGLCMGGCIGLTARLERRIEPVEGVSWSWTAIRKDIIKWLLIGISLIVGVIAALPFMISSHDLWLGYFLTFGFTSVLQLVLVMMLVSGVTRGLSRRTLDAQQIVTPNQGIWRSARYGVIMAVITGMIVAIFTGLGDFTAYYWLPLHMGSISITTPLGIDLKAVSIMSHLLGFYPAPSSQGFWILHALFWGLVGAAVPGLTIGLSCGGLAYVQHFVLRFLLWCSRSVPVNYPRFLDYAAERILLRKVGGGYIFIHRLLLEYFAGGGAATMPSVQMSPQKGSLLLPVHRELLVPQAALGGSLGLISGLDEPLNPLKQWNDLGQQVGEYRLVRKLGSSSSGVIYLGEHVYEHTLVVVKVLRTQRALEEDFIKSIDEAGIARLSHPHIVPLLDFGISRDNIPFLVTEYVSEETLRDRHPEGDRVGLSTLVSYVEQLASALQYAHEHRVIHQDVKPQNILIGRNGALKISDFGLAKVLEQNVVISQQRQVGTPAYMAPELHMGNPCSASDQYALAVVIYEWVCGTRPFQGTALGLVTQHINTPPPSLRNYVPTVPEAVEQVLFKALAKAPEDRFECIQEFADALCEAVSLSDTYNIHVWHS